MLVLVSDSDAVREGSPKAASSEYLRRLGGRPFVSTELVDACDVSAGALGFVLVDALALLDDASDALTRSSSGRARDGDTDEGFDVCTGAASASMGDRLGVGAEKLSSKSTALGGGG